MKHLKKYFQINVIIIALIMVGSCSSENNTELPVEEEDKEEILAITDFKISSEIHSFSVINASIQSADSLVICLFTSPVDYANLTPTVEYLGTRMEYRINNDDFKVYDVEENIDFSYPNIVDFKVSNVDNSSSKIYRIIVDTENPVLFTNEEITIPDSQVNTNYSGIEIGTWKNVGNHPIRVTMRTENYIDVITPNENINNIFSTTLTSETNVNPNDMGAINIFTSNASVVGAYGTTALFDLYFNENLGYIVYDDITGAYVNDIGYTKAALKIKGNIVD